MSAREIKILVSECSGFSETAAALLRQTGSLILADLARADLLSAMRDADVLWVRLRHRIDAEVMRAAPRLKVVVTPTTGLNHIDVKEAERRAIEVLSLRGETEFLKDVRATAEHTLALMLASYRSLPEAAAHVREGGWNRDFFRGRELYGKTVGIVGYGRLGRIVAHYLRAFGTRILITDPHSDARSIESWVTPVSLPELLRDADIVTVHVNLSGETQGLLGRPQFAAMKKGACLINTSRGELIDERALLEALESGHLAGAALDVLCDECSDGMGSHPLITYARAHDNLIVTPHIGGCTLESMEKTEMFLAERLTALLKREAGGN